MRRSITVAFLVSVLTACRGPAADSVAGPSASSGIGLVARFGELEITAAEVDARILALPPADRPEPGQELDAWYEEQIRELVVEHGLRAEATANRLEDEEAFVAARREAEKTLAVQLCVAELKPQIDDVGEDALRAAYDARAESFAVPDRRAVFHLFLRHARGLSREAARAEIEALRERVLAGESFQRLAAAYSDSESRHREGALGWVTRGQLPAGFEAAIFGLDEGVPSTPIATRDGQHLFYVGQILPARQLSFDEARTGLRAGLVAERGQAAVAEIEAEIEGEIEPPPGTYFLDRAEFAAVAEAGDPAAVVLRVADVELTLANLRRQLRQTVARRPAARQAESDEPPADAWQLLEHLRRRELLYLHCRTHDKIPAAELGAGLATWSREALLSSQRQRRLLEVAARDEGRLRLFYAGNAGRFSKPPRWHLQRLRISLDDGARAAMARLEEAASRPGSIGLEGLGAELGGEIEDLGLRSLAELRRLEPKLPPLIAPLAVGELSPPYRTENALEIVDLLARQEAEPVPFAEVRERVAAAYLEQYTREVYRELADEILQNAELEILPEALAALRDAGLPQADVSVEQLEELLAEL